MFVKRISKVHQTVRQSGNWVIRWLCVSRIELSQKVLAVKWNTTRLRYLFFFRTWFYSDLQSAKIVY